MYDVEDGSYLGWIVQRSMCAMEDEARMVEDGRARMQRSMHAVEDGGKDCAACRCTRDGGAVNSGQGGGDGGSL